MIAPYHYPDNIGETIWIRQKSPWEIACNSFTKRDKPDHFDDLDQILSEWTIKAAKTVLNEIQKRLTIIVYSNTFQNVLEKAKARLFHLQSKVKEAHS